MKTLQDGQEIRVKGFSQYASSIKVGTARGYAKKYNENAEAAHRRAIDNGHDTAYAIQMPSIITADYKGKSEELDAKAKATAQSVEIENGEQVEIEGDTFTVKVLGERYSDPVKFVKN